MPQGLPKKIQVALLLADLALELRDPTPRRGSLSEQRTPQGRPVQGVLARPPWTAQRFQSALSNLLLPLVYTATVDLKVACHGRYIFPSRNSLDRSSLQFCRKPRSLPHQFLSLGTVRYFTVSLSGCTPERRGVEAAQDNYRHFRRLFR
jgi:hypothetical protein